MIIVKLMGGLGNQLFQYAFAKYLATKHGVDLKVDVSELNMDSLHADELIRTLGLKNFNVNLTLATESELKTYRKSKLNKVWDLFLLNIPVSFNKLYIREPHFYFYRKAMNAPSDCYLDGYWQSEKYFSEIRNQLLLDFSVVSELSEETKRLVEKVKSQNSVSIHVRRGDYLSIQGNQQIYETCDEAYYLAAMKCIELKNSDCVFYVFSDEPEWFKKNIHTDYSVQYVTHNTGKNSFQDLFLMSLCKHNIIANSSFSWWGAWLNQYADKMVVAPKKWFKNNIKDTSDLIPKSWIQL